MLSVHGRKTAALVVEPVARSLNAVGISPNTVTVAGGVLTIVAVVALIPTGHLFLAAVLSALFVMFDLIDGAMARLQGGGTALGATLDATCDRLTDGALFSAIMWWLVYTHDAGAPLVIAALVTLVSSQATSYVKARAEASGLSIQGGLVERAERLIISLTGIGLQGLGVPYAIDVALYALAAGGVFTVVQRLRAAAVADAANRRGSASISGEQTR